MNAKKILLFVPVFIVFLAAGLLSSCKKEINSPTSDNTTHSSYFLKGKLGNETIDFSGTSNYYTDESVLQNEDEEHCGEHSNNGHHYGDGNVNNGQSGDDDENEADEDDLAVIISGSSWNTTGSNNKMLTQGTIEIRGLVVRIWVNPAKAQTYFDLFTPGIHSFAHENGAKAGAYVTVRDGNGILWTSKGDQTGSTFEVLTRGELGTNSTTVTGVVNCKLYDANGNVRPFTNGTFSATVGIAN